jgi:very-short-patch-repair endonuclease
MSEPANDQARQRIRQLFRFLQAFNEKKNPIPTQISEQARVRRWNDLPAHPNLRLTALEDTPLDDPADDPSAQSEPEVADFVLKVHRADVPEPPALPELLAGWIVEGWEDPRQRPVTVASRPTSTGNDELFEGDPQRPTGFEDWAAQWETWAAAARAAYEVNLVFNWLFDVQADMEREAERHELVLGDGLLNWYRPSGGVNFPVLLQRLQIEYDARIPEFTVREADRPPELNASLLRRSDVDGGVAAELIAEAERLRISPLGAGRTTEFLRRLVATIAADGQYVEEGAPQGEKEFPRVGRDPVLFMRNRAQGFEAAISNILDDIETREEFPESLLSITGIHSSQDDAAEPVTWEQGDETSDVLLSKEANREQLEIARRLARHGAVRVQGPPGTGKTHTIANLVGHLLANEKSVLVTSHTTKALRVLRDKVVPELQPLCVSVLEGDAASRSQLSASITRMSARLGSGTRDQLLREAARLRERREALLSQVQRQRARLLAAVGTEYEEFVFEGKSLTTEQAARLVAAGVGLHDWIPGTVSGSLPLSLAEIDALYAATARISLTQERTLGERLPLFESLLQPSAFELAATRRVQIEASGIAQYRPELWDKSSRTADRLRSLAEAAKAAAADVSAAPDWYLAAAAAGDANEAERIPWLEMAQLLQEAERTARDQRLAMVRYGPQLCDALAPGEAITRIREVRDHVAAGGGLGWLTLMLHGHWRKVVQESSCLGAPPWTTDALDALATVPLAALAWQALVHRWDLQFERFRIEPPQEAESTDRADEEQCHRFAMLIEGALELATQRIAPVMSHGSDLGLDWRQLAPEFESSIPSADRWRQLGATLGQELQAVIQSELARIEHAEIAYSFSCLAELLKSYPAVDMSHSPLAALLEATVSIDPARYGEAHAALADLLDRSQSLAQRQAYLLRLSPAAPDWADAIRLRRPPHDAARPPGDARKAWEWSTIHDELERRCSEQLADLIAAVEMLKGDLREVTIQLIDRLAWAGQMKRTDPASRQRLQLWLEAIKKIGKGSGKNVPRLRRAAQEHMAAARSAVPVWIAPLSRVAESFDAQTTHFDVVIIDEASQCDVMGIIALYLGSQVIVVGDDQQVTPDAVGDRIDTANQLIDTFLQGVPGKELYDGQYSIYQIAGTAFSGATQLREHFRCVPDIIRFSNALSYNWEILPLRDASDGQVRPSVVSERVAGTSDGKRNHEEARQVASLILAACEQPEYAEASFGAISLVGGEQTRDIEILLRNNMPLADYERRRILCGTPPQFQGDERDVIFLSVVEGPSELPPLRSLGEGPREMYKKRYNVAASRARDQLWVVHSLDPGRDLKPDDLRWRLLDFARNPAGLKSKIEQAQARSESPLETAVIQRVVTAGYPVTPQFEVGGYRIDLVVGTEKSRLAVECDGDRYHTQDDLQHDLERQALLERLGWRFVRIRGGEFFRDPDRALQPLFKRLAEMGISPGATVSSDPAQQDPAAEELLERVRRRAAEIRASWDTQPTGRGARARDEEIDWGAATPRASAPPKAPRRSAAEPDKPERPEPVLPPPALVVETARERSPARQTSVASDDLIATLEERGVEYIDKRPNGGALWAVGGAELSTMMSDLAKRGYKFTFSASGGRATMHRPGWFVK